MRKLDFNDIKLCQFQGKLFEESLTRTNTSSSIFIRRFMYSNLATKLDDKSFITLSLDIQDCFNEINQEFGESNYGKIKYTKEQMFWIGYIYRSISILYKLPSKQVFKLLNTKEIIKYYDIYHTFDIVQASEKIMENIGYETKDYTEEGIKILKRLILKEKLEKLIGSTITITIEKEIKQSNIYSGHVYEMNNQQKAYVLGLNSYVDKCEGKVIAVMERKKDKNFTLIASNNRNEIFDDVLKRQLEHIEKDSKIKLIYKFNH